MEKVGKGRAEWGDVDLGSRKVDSPMDIVQGTGFTDTAGDRWMEAIAYFGNLLIC